MISVILTIIVGLISFMVVVPWAIVKTIKDWKSQREHDANSWMKENVQPTTKIWRCPNCGVILQIPIDATSWDCEWCKERGDCT